MPRVILNPNSRRKLYDIVFRCVRSDLNSFVHILDTLNGLVPFYMDEPGKNSNTTTIAMLAQWLTESSLTRR